LLQLHLRVGLLLEPEVELCREVVPPLGDDVRHGRAAYGCWPRSAAATGVQAGCKARPSWWGGRRRRTPMTTTLTTTVTTGSSPAAPAVLRRRRVGGAPRPAEAIAPPGGRARPARARARGTRGSLRLLRGHITAEGHERDFLEEVVDAVDTCLIGFEDDR